MSKKSKHKKHQPLFVRPLIPEAPKRSRHLREMIHAILHAAAYEAYVRAAAMEPGSS